MERGRVVVSGKRWAACTQMVKKPACAAVCRRLPLPAAARVAALAAARAVLIHRPHLPS